MNTHVLISKSKWWQLTLAIFGIVCIGIGTSDVLENVFARCCILGVNWAREDKSCDTFPSPVPGEAQEHQDLCLTTAPICCLRFYRDEECSKGKIAAQDQQECKRPHSQGGEFFQDCCEACKLGMLSSAVGTSCTFRSFNFGFPWDNAYYSCCSQNSQNEVFGNIPTPPQGPYRPKDQDNTDNQLYVNNGPIIPDSENLCLKFPGQLCGQVCIPTAGSYRCACRAGFTLSLDGKTCVQDFVSDRCKLNNPCEHICRDTGMAIECSCNPGYTLSINHRSCKDIDECHIGSHQCLPDQVCYNQAGTYACINGDGSLTAPGWRPGEELLGNRISKNKYQQTLPSDTGSGRCPTGYKFNLESRVCDDIDECSTNLHDCDHKLEFCVNTLGGYTCQIKENPTDCPAGYKYDVTVQACQDVNECEENLHLCNVATETCVNEAGGYTCILETKTKVTETPLLIPTTISNEVSTTTNESVNIIIPGKKAPKCPLGYDYNSLQKSCVDIDECASSPCVEGEVCTNSQGSYQCRCRDGYKRHSVTGGCIDVNECALGLHTCTLSQRCDNTAGSYICVRTSACGTGYTLNHDTGECEDNDECELGTDDCDQVGPQYECVNIEGSYRCSKKGCPEKQLLAPNGTCVDIVCRPGFVAYKRNCIDVDECQEAPGPCRRNELCLNVEGSYRCRPRLNCGPGFQMNEPGTACIDVDECLEGSHQCSGGQECVNRQGDYLCQCPTGYRLNAQRQCEDINECQFYYRGACPSNSICENVPGSYTCTCKDGYRNTDHGKICVDIDECKEIPGVCHQGCINVGGSYFCKCNAGFNLDSDNRTCIDINECESFNGRLCVGLCVNNAGSFNCECPGGYELASDQRTCIDINECETGSPCTEENDICVNTRGGYKCNTITCPPNYKLDPDYKNRCKRISLYCREGDLECLKQPLSYAYNFYPLPRNLNLPLSGQADLFTMRGPPWSSRTVDFILELESARAPVGVKPATRQSFLLKRTAFNQAVISLLESLEGPQEVQLVLNMKLYRNGIYIGSAQVKLLIYVSEYDF